jgi:hypothetical protein
VRAHPYFVGGLRSSSNRDRCESNFGPQRHHCLEHEISGIRLATRLGSSIARPTLTVADATHPIITAVPVFLACHDPCNGSPG